jgi:phosphate transport system substrate-binding protein
MGKIFFGCLCFAWLCLSVWGCGSGNGKIPQESPTSGTLNLSADESFKPVIDQQIKVFRSSFPGVFINVKYESEADCFRDLAGDSTRMVIVTRGLSKVEEKFFEDSIHYVPVYGKLAYDAIAVILNNANADTILKMQDIRNVLLDSGNLKLQPVMDGVRATSTVRYMIDSVLNGRALAKSVVAARSSEGVIDYVSKTKDAIGFIGVSWIGNQDDPIQLSFMDKVKVAAIGCENCGGETYIRPYQANIALGRYPMIRDLYYILKENFSGVGNNFVNFLQFERGQLIFRRAYLVPARMSFDVRSMQIRN